MLHLASDYTHDSKSAVLQKVLLSIAMLILGINTNDYYTPQKQPLQQDLITKGN